MAVVSGLLVALVVLLNRIPHDTQRNRQILWIAGEGMITRRPC